MLLGKSNNSDDSSDDDDKVQEEKDDFFEDASEGEGEEEEGDSEDELDMGSSVKKGGNRDDNVGVEGNLEMTFNLEAEAAAKEIVEKNKSILEDKKNGKSTNKKKSAWQEYLDKKKEKKKEKRQERKTKAK